MKKTDENISCSIGCFIIVVGFAFAFAIFFWALSGFPGLS